ncbi:hypothetical protein PHAVU_005G019800 [Phaseolus vulgaris]|uniref:DNA sliding clamp PCNA n=1 Tax=Phaseolus vulgaris TaxID=3885 RepID=V7BUZ1_PHAVU|nr:hypothetical protein PHAVU_005G019800g [Phaseolus vulgaris]ESW20848.1 hypothetical protein PHAVU_005G019800g [Phaseolus vulgaris]
MLELRLLKGSLMKKVVECMKELVNEANFDCSSTGISVQTRDSTGSVIVALLLRSDGFKHYRCDHNISIGINLKNMAEMMKCVGNDDIMTTKVDDGGDTVNFMFESPDKIYDFEIKMVDIDSQQYWMSEETEYDATVKMASSEFARVCRDLNSGTGTFVISVSNEAVKFSIEGEDFGCINIVCMPEEASVIDMKEPISLRFALGYMQSFTNAAPLSNTVSICLSKNLPCLVQYKITEIGYLRFYVYPRNTMLERIKRKKENIGFNPYWMLG